MRKLVLGLIFILLFAMQPHIANSSHSFRRVKSHVFRSGAVNFNGRSKEFEVNGSEDHSLAWDLDSSCTVFVEMIFPNGAGGTFAVAPAELGNSQANPIIISGAGKGMVALFVPVAPTLRITITGAVSGVFVFNDS